MEDQNQIETPSQQDLEIVSSTLETASPLYCARCYHSFCCKEVYDDAEYDSENGIDDEVSSSDEEETISPIFQEDPEDVEEQILHMISDAMQSNPLAMWRASFQKELIKTVSAELVDEWMEEELCEEYDLPEIERWVKEMADYYFKTEPEFPPRQGGNPIPLTPLRKTAIAHKLRLLNDMPASQQRTQEWYETRYGLLTASNVWKALGTEAQQNQLIVEKCQPFEQFKADCARHANLSPDNPMAWGQKYEAITALLYERMNRTKLGEYGCIVHPEWSFLGASPDGINIDPGSPLYGRMVEIKNIVNREIDGIPLDAYWVQMQIQMEVCDLDECDFVETRIKEYATKEEFVLSENPWRGIILSFVPRITIETTMNPQKFHPTTKPFYEYYLLSENDAQQAEDWIQAKHDQHSKEFVLSNCAYWGLDQYSCVLVKRNSVWVDNAMPYIERIWRIIEKERITGCEHRAPKKRGGQRDPEPKTYTICKLE